MGNINSKAAARKKVRESQARANEARLERERHNVDDAASFLVELGRLAAVDEWEQGRIAEVRAEANRRRHEHRQVGAAAVSRMQGRGESLAAIAALASVKVGDVRTVLKAAGAEASPRPEALGAASRASSAAGDAAGDAGAPNDSSAIGVAPQPVRESVSAKRTAPDGLDAQRPRSAAAQPVQVVGRES